MASPDTSLLFECNCAKLWIHPSAKSKDNDAQKSCRYYRVYVCSARGLIAWHSNMLHLVLRKFMKSDKHFAFWGDCF